MLDTASSVLVAMTNIQYTGNAEKIITAHKPRYVSQLPRVSCGARFT
jgi:hypothetical protein